MTQKKQAKPKRRGNAHTTRARILEIATALFFERGYEAVGLREIAANAGVTAAMINRYFGTKEALFLELMGDTFTFSLAKVGPRHEFGRTMANQLLLQPYGICENRGEMEQQFRRSNIVIRSAGMDGAPPQIQEYLNTRLWQPLISWLGGKHAPERAEMIVGTILGVMLLSKSISGPSQKNAEPIVLADFLARSIQHYVDAE